MESTSPLREEGMGLDEAICNAGDARLLPVVLTMPSAAGVPPLACTISGGVVSSTLLALPADGSP